MATESPASFAVVGEEPKSRPKVELLERALILVNAIIDPSQCKCEDRDTFLQTTELHSIILDLFMKEAFAK